jgi:hypothetical protein
MADKNRAKQSKKRPSKKSTPPMNVPAAPAAAPVVDYTSRTVAPTAGARGRPPTYRDAAVTEKIVRLVQGGNYVETAAAAAGVSVSTVRAWLKKAGELERALRDDPTMTLTSDEELLVDFSAAVEKAQGEAEARDVLTIGRAAEGTKEKPGDWRASAWRLQHRSPERWGRNLVELSGRDGGPVQHENVGNPLELVAAKLDALAAARAKQAGIDREPPTVPDAE